ncbi:MAG: hypothetical protein ABSA30_10810 [Candidatus Aminicenantales bacterium]|jgi:hypothetical protein
MKKIILIGLAAAALLGPVVVPAALNGPYDKLLTIADVQAVGKMTGLKLIPYDPSKGAGGDLNFALADGTMALLVQFQTMDAKRWEKDKAAQKNYIRGPVAGLGDEAFDGPPGNFPYALTIRKGSRVVALSSFADMKTGKFIFSMEQLTALAKIILGRM